MRPYHSLAAASSGWVSDRESDGTLTVAYRPEAMGHLPLTTLIFAKAAIETASGRTRQRFAV
jgi:hypothetical protein